MTLQCMYLPQFMGSLNTHNMNTLCGTVLRTSFHTIKNYTDSDGESGTGGNFRLSHATPRLIRMVHIVTQQKLHDSCNVASDQFNVQFRLWHGSPTHGHNPAGDAHHFFFIFPRATREPAAHNNGCGPLP